MIQRKITCVKFLHYSENHSELSYKGPVPEKSFPWMFMSVVPWMSFSKRF